MSLINGPSNGDWSVFASKVAEERDTLEYELSLVRRERDELHRLVCACLAALGNGSGASERASVEFLSNAPHEVSNEIQYLKQEIKKLTQVIDKLRTLNIKEVTNGDGN